MKRVVLSVALLALFASPVAAQDQTFEVKTSTGTYEMSMTITEGAGDKVAMAAEEDRPDYTKVMFLDVPDDDHILRTEQFSESRAETRMLPTDSIAQGVMFADTVCTSRWNTRKDGSHTFTSNFEKGESEMDWAMRHQNGFYVISSVYLIEGKLSDRDPARSPTTRNQVSTSWTDTDGVEHDVSTKQRKNEDKAMWLARHRRVVGAFAEALQPKA
jgi:hypothetical protein